MKHTLSAVDGDGTEFFAGEFQPFVTSNGWAVSGEAWGKLYEAYGRHFGATAEGDDVDHTSIQRLSSHYNRANKRTTVVYSLLVWANRRLRPGSYYKVPGSERTITLTLVEDYVD